MLNDPDLVARLQAELAEARAVIAQLEQELQIRDRRVGELSALVRQMQDQLRRLLRGRFGAKTERFLGPQVGQQLIDGIAQLLSAEEQAAARGESPLPAVTAPVVADAAENTEATSTTSVAKRKPRRSAIPLSQRYPDLPVTETIIDPPADELIDSHGKRKVLVGREVTETLVVNGPTAEIDRTIRNRYASARTQDERVIAPLPPRITEAGSLHDRTIHWLMSQRYGWSFPFCRSLTLLELAGVRLNASTINDAAADWAQVMEPLADEIRRELWTAPVLFVDHAVMRQQDHTLQGKCRRIPVFATTDGALAWFHAPPTLTDARAAEVLEGYLGDIHGDDWSGWDPYDPSSCNAHARRPFAELQHLSHEARDILFWYSELALIEAAVREQANDLALRGPALWEFRLVERHRLGAAQVMNQLLERANAIAATHPKKTTLGNGARYLIRLWDSLTRFLRDGRLLPDNNTAERALRTIALNRKNSLFLGRGEHAPKRAAIAWTIFGSCRLQGIDPLAYLNDITPELLRYRNAVRAKTDTLPSLAHLTPTAWKQRQQEQRDAAHRTAA